MSSRYLAIVNPAAGGGRCGKLAEPALARLRTAGIDFDVQESHAPGEATALTRAALRQGYRRFIAVGGDGTTFEIVNGLFPRDEGEDRPALAFLPLGTGNSFLRDFIPRGVEQSAETLLAGRSRRCDVIRLTHVQGVFHYVNLLTLGFAADVAALANRRFKRLGELGYVLAVLACLARLDRRSFPLRVDGAKQPQCDRCLFLAFSNTKFTGGKMMIAPHADPTDGLIEFVRWGPIGRWGLLRNLATLFDGTHIHHALASRSPARRIDFELSGPANVMIDGESMILECQRLEVLPGALDVLV
jgi:diacylglycerol kinase (ATP)